MSNNKSKSTKAPATQVGARKTAPVKSAAKVKSVSKTRVAAATTSPAKPPKGPKLRQKPVRDSFTMPASDFALIATLKSRLLAAKRETKKSELLRAGLHVLAALDASALAAAVGQLDPIKVGRPTQGH